MKKRQNYFKFLYFRFTLYCDCFSQKLAHFLSEFGGFFPENAVLNFHNNGSKLNLVYLPRGNLWTARNLLFESLGILSYLRIRIYFWGGLDPGIKTDPDRYPDPVCTMVLILDGNSKHVGHVCRNTGISWKIISDI